VRVAQSHVNLLSVVWSNVIVPLQWEIISLEIFIMRCIRSMEKQRGTGIVRDGSSPERIDGLLRPVAFQFCSYSFWLTEATSVATFAA